MITALWFGLASIGMAQSTGSALSVTPCDFAEKYQFSEASCQIELANSSAIPIEISNAKANLASDRVSQTSLTVPAHGVAYLEATVNTLNETGRVSHYFSFATNEAGQAKRNAEAHGFVASVLDDAKAELDFSVVDLSKPLPTKEIRLDSRETESFRITKILEAPSYLDVELKDGRLLQVKIKPDIPWGLHNDYVKLAINAPQQGEAWVKVKSDIHGDIVPADNPYGFGLLRQGNKNEILIRLSNRAKQDFAVGTIKLEGIDGTTQVVACEPVEKGCRAIKFTLGEKQVLGRLNGKMLVELPEYKRDLPIVLWGIYVAADTKVRSFEEEAAKQAAANADKSAQSVSPAAMQSAIKRAIKSANTAVPPGDGPLLKWNVANEQLIYGYIIYRSDREDGAFQRINKETIKVASEDGTGSDYQWRDNAAQPGKIYWYYIGMVYKDGHKQQLSGPQKVVAK